MAQHLSPDRESHLKEILARRSPLPVRTVTQHEPLQDGVVFMVPANKHVNITDSAIDLSSEQIIKERAALLEGGTDVYSSPEGGAGVRVRLPLLNGGG